MITLPRGKSQLTNGIVIKRSETYNFLSVKISNVTAFSSRTDRRFLRGKTTFPFWPEKIFAGIA